MAGRNKGRKCNFDECFIPEINRAAVHGIVMELSPIKDSIRNKSVRYFYGQKSVRVVSSDPSLRPTKGAAWPL